MNRDKRRQNLQIRPYLDRLETRRLMSLGGAKARFAHEMVHERTALETQLAGGDLSAFALKLVQHPRIAADLGLGALSQALRQHVGYAERHGWGASLVSELTAHPRYAAAHRLTAALSPPKIPQAAPANPPAQAVGTTTQSALPSGGGVTPTSPSPTPAAIVGPAVPSPVVQDPLSIAVGGTLDVTLPSFGLGTSGLTFTITPQPLPANMTFNRETGELVFAPAPGQAGVTDLSVAVSNGSASGKIELPVTVTEPAVASTEVSGQVVDENGTPLAGMPVAIGDSSAVTNASGQFILTSVQTNPGPISAGGSVGTAQGRLDLTAPVAQLLGHAVYLGANNAIPAPLILPTIAWSAPASATQPSASQPMTITNPAMPGFSIQVPASPSCLDGLGKAGTVSVANMSAALSAQHMSPGVRTATM